MIAVTSFVSALTWVTACALVGEGMARYAILVAIALTARLLIVALTISAVLGPGYVYPLARATASARICCPEGAVNGDAPSHSTGPLMITVLLGLTSTRT